MPKVRELKHHEQKLLKKVDFLNWKSDGVTPEYKEYILKTIQKYQLRDQKEFFNYQRIATQINNTINNIKQLDDKLYRDFKVNQLVMLGKKLFDMGILDSEAEIETLNKITVGRLCRRRISYLLKVLHFAESGRLANMYIQHGHIRIGPEVVRDEAFLVSRNLEDFITWTNKSKIKTTIQKFNETYDDFEALLE
ncbi:hypothetical protein FDP41_010852 [Naegleria fowleri]|uniref:RNA-binding S4 domain-containing protein n=1 Tax=Naegleria fowleri TaxID=5763 RepID=A0A6A5BXQ4_NAEFO|nr:uncharacterized protein FDP41_010852 [Naegleria fowleri]KAF0982873.1 hypothetical protein FDP41_010852 [Naegleria fowleri]CAG4709157.1 unnamed protein product [Naegleria fowleri]